MTTTREAADPRAILAHHQPLAVVLDLVNLERAGGGRATFNGWHGPIKPEGRRMIIGSRIEQ